MKETFRKLVPALKRPQRPGAILVVLRIVRAIHGVAGASGLLFVVLVGVPGPSAPAPARQVGRSLETPGGIAVRDGQWETLRASSVDVHHPPAQREDAELYAGFIEAVHRALRAEFAGFPVDRLLQTPVRCGVWLHPAATDRVSAGSALAATSYGARPYCELHFLAPSAYREQDRCCTKVGERRDVDQLRRIAAHEYSTILLDRITRQRGGWRFHSAPKWFEQGYEEYLGCILAGEHTRTVTLRRYRELVAGTPDRLRDNEVENPYIDGAVLVEFLHAEFGRAKVQAILSRPAATFEEALHDALGLSQRALFERARAKLRGSNQVSPARTASASRWLSAPMARRSFS